MRLNFTLIIFLLLVCKFSSAQKLTVQDINLIVSGIQGLSKGYLIDSGKLKLPYSSDSLIYYDIYHFDSVTHELVSADHMQDTSSYRDLISFHYSKGKPVKIQYGFYLLENNRQLMAKFYEHYYRKKNNFHTEIPYNHNSGYYKFLTARKLYQMGIGFYKKFRAKKK